MSYLPVQQILQAVVSIPWDGLSTLVLKDIDAKYISHEGIHFHKELEITVIFNDPPDGGNITIEQIILKKPNIIHRAILLPSPNQHLLNILIEPNHIMFGLHQHMQNYIKDVPAMNLQTWGYNLETAMIFIKKQMDSFSDTSHDSDHLFIFIKGLISALLCTLTQAAKMNDQQVLSTAEIAGNYIREYYYRQNLSVGEIAEFVGLTPNYFVNVFKKEFKMTIRQYIILTRLEASQALLKTQKYLVRDVAKLTGWSNQYYFSSCFKQYYQYSPSSVGKDY